MTMHGKINRKPTYSTHGVGGTTLSTKISECRSVREARKRAAKVTITYK